MLAYLLVLLALFILGCSPPSHQTVDAAAMTHDAQIDAQPDSAPVPSHPDSRISDRRLLDHRLLDQRLLDRRPGDRQRESSAEPPPHNCAEIIDCFDESCSGTVPPPAACVKMCESAAPPAAQTAANHLMTCLLMAAASASCSAFCSGNPNNANCLSCVNTICQSEIVACFVPNQDGGADAK